MKLMRWVIEVRRFRLLVDCMAACVGQPLTHTKRRYPLARGRNQLTHSAAASSSASFSRRWSLCCFRSDWLFLGVDDVERVLEPAPKPQDPPARRWP